MSSPATPSADADDPGPDLLAQVLDVVTYAVATTALFSVVSAVVAVAIGGRAAPGVKYGLFVFGWLAFGYATFQLLPSRPWKDDDEENLFATPDRSETGFQAFVQRLPPARFRQVEPKYRATTGVRVFLSALVMFVVSILLELAFGIGP